MADDPPWTRHDLIRLIAGSLKRSLTYLNSSQAEVMADSVLRDLKAAGLRIVRPKKTAGLILRVKALREVVEKIGYKGLAVQRR